MKVTRALISVSEKMGVVDFARELAKMGVEILSTGGTARLLKENDVPVRPVDDFTGFPEMLDGRVKTLHPKVHGGILNIRDDEKHARQKAEHGIEDIDLVAVNLYPFESTIAKEGVTLDEAVEQIDIGGPTMIRSAAKNWKYVTVVVDHGDYSRVIEEMHRNGGGTTPELRYDLACKVFAHTARYDSLIAGYLEAQSGHEPPARKEPEGSPDVLRLELAKVGDLRYGENAHQSAAFYVRRGAREASAATAKLISGKALSFNNILDATAALEIVKDLEEPAASVIKHTNPCGAAVGKTLAEAYAAAFEGDPVSAFGSIVGLNRRVDAATAEAIAQPERFVEAVIAPAFDEEAVRILTTKEKWGKNVRLLAAGDLSVRDRAEFDLRAVVGGLLRQDRDHGFPEIEDPTVATRRKPTEDETRDLGFAWIVCKHVKSNAITVAKAGAVVGVGAGQMSRVDAAWCAVRKAGERAKGAVAASDAFFPFPDAMEMLADAGVTAVIQPGGAKNDPAVIEAANKRKLAMLLTGRRHFRH
jgi:phosphoribosylaminoimidazolecarboxamide formyltransferase/IMP cyclohydrolase